MQEPKKKKKIKPRLSSKQGLDDDGRVAEEEHKKRN
jgi:hypothetical protein